MAQTPATKLQDSIDILDYTPVAAVTAGDVVLRGGVPCIALRDIPANTPGAVAAGGVFLVPKTSGALSDGDAIYWHTTGTPVYGDASSGACNGTASGGYLMGFLVGDAASDDESGKVALTAAKRTATIAGSATADDLTGSDSSLGINGLAAAQGGAVAVAGGTSSTSGNAGGAVSLTGGTPGATGAGGAVAIAGGVGGSTSGAGGAVTIAGGAGTAGNGNGGALTLRGGNAHGSGTDGAIAIGDANTESITLGKMPRIPTTTVAAAGSNQGNAAALSEGFNLVTGADDTKGVVLPAAVAGMQVIIKVGDGADLKI